MLEVGIPCHFNTNLERQRKMVTVLYWCCLVQKPRTQVHVLLFTSRVPLTEAFDL